MMFLYSLLLSHSGHRLSGYLEVPENDHCTCLEQLYFFRMHCPMYSKTGISQKVSPGYQLYIALATGLMCPLAVLPVQKQFCASRQSVNVQPNPSMSDFTLSDLLLAAILFR